MKWPYLLPLGLMGCKSLSALGGVAESTAYPAAGAAIGSAGGPLGSAAGAGVGHLVQLAVEGEVSSSEVIDGVRYITLEPTPLGFISAFWPWIVAALLVAHFAPWIPGQVIAYFKKKRGQKRTPQV